MSQAKLGTAQVSFVLGDDKKSFKILIEKGQAPEANSMQFFFLMLNKASCQKGQARWRLQLFTFTQQNTKLSIS